MEGTKARRAALAALQEKAKTGAYRVGFTDGDGKEHDVSYLLDEQNTQVGIRNVIVGGIGRLLKSLDAVLAADIALAALEAQEAQGGEN